MMAAFQLDRHIIKEPIIIQVLSGMVKKEERITPAWYRSVAGD